MAEIPFALYLLTSASTGTGSAGQAPLPCRLQPPKAGTWGDLQGLHHYQGSPHPVQRGAGE